MPKNRVLQPMAQIRPEFARRTALQPLRIALQSLNPQVRDIGPQPGQVDLTRSNRVPDVVSLQPSRHRKH